MNKHIVPDIEKVEESLLNLDTEQVHCPVAHRFSDGVYIREITMPPGNIILGAEHTTTHFNIVSKGRCILVDVDTLEQSIIQAPCTFESKAGVRKLLYIEEECVWSTVHVTEERDIEVLESTLIKLSPTYKKIVGDKFIAAGGQDELCNSSSRSISRSGDDFLLNEPSTSKGTAV